MGGKNRASARDAPHHRFAQGREHARKRNRAAIGGPFRAVHSDKELAAERHARELDTQGFLPRKIFSIKVPAIIEAQLSENASIMEDVDDLHAINPRTETLILKRARMVYPVWLRANTALAALLR